MPVHCALSFYHRLASLLFVIGYSTIFVVRSVRMNIQTRPWRILGYRWHDYLSNNLVLSEAGLRQVTCIVRECQLGLYGHVARLPAEDPAHPILLAEI